MKCLHDYRPDLVVKKRIGRDSVNAQVFVACDKNNNCNYVFKKMPLDVYSIDSLYRNYCNDKKIAICDKKFLNSDDVFKYHNDFRVMIHSSWVELFVMNLSNVLLDEKICFNLPRTYEYSFCDVCDYNKKIINCALVITDLADEGDLQGWLVKKDRSPLELFSMLFQVYAGLYALRKYFNIIHNDMHAGNVLVKKIKTSTNSFLKYVIDGKEYFIPNTGYIFIIWDFGYAQIPNFIEISNYAKLREKDLKLYGDINVVDYTRITSVIKHFLPSKYQGFKNIIDTFILKNSKKGIRLENILNVFSNYRKPKNDFTIFDSCSFDKKIKKFNFKPLYKHRYKPKKQNVLEIPNSFLFATNLNILDDLSIEYNIKDMKMLKFDNLILNSIKPPLPDIKLIKSNLSKPKLKRTIDAMQDTVKRSQEKAKGLKPMSIDFPQPTKFDFPQPMSIDFPKFFKTLDYKKPSKSKSKNNIWNILKKMKLK